MSIRFRLIIAFIAVVLIANAVVSWITIEYVGEIWLEEVYRRVRLDLNSARAAYDDRLAGIQRFLEAASLHRGLAVQQPSELPEIVEHHLQRLHAVGGMDLVSLIAADGRVVYRAHNPGRRGDALLDNAIVSLALDRDEAVHGTIVLPAEALAREGERFARRARFELVPTPAARTTNEDMRTDGMLLAAAVPVRGADGRTVAVLFGADLLNRRYEIVDAIRDEVLAHEKHNGREIGTVTIFQHDLRISTNVARDDGERAVGTRLSSTVYEQVLEEGEVYDDRAFVVNDWYITAYEPIRDPANRTIGALYVGLLEAPFAQKRNTIFRGFIAVIVAATLVSLALLVLVTLLVLKPIGRITAMSHKIVGGDLSARVGIRPPGEMGELCQAIDAMADAVAEREARLKATTEQQIGRSEKMASIGRLASGVAHEINNPLTGVLTFAHLLRDRPTIDDEDRQDLDVIINETKRVSEIVQGLLDFARERPAERTALDVNDVIQRTIRLIRNQKPFRQITVEENLAPNPPPVSGDANHLQQVLLNLALNACEAMPEGGSLTFQSGVEADRVIMRVIDTGCGIEPRHLDQIFEPFFSTKPVGKGTGLGLSVSYGIIEQHGGRIEVDSQPGAGTTFTIILPADTAPTQPTEASDS